MMHRDRRFHEDFPVTTILILLNAAFFAIELAGHKKQMGELPQMGDLFGITQSVTRALGSLSLGDLHRGEYWRLLSSAFLHGSLIHLLLNMLVLFDLGRLTEPNLSSRKLLTVYVACALGAALASVGHSAWLGGAAGNLRSSVGASGALTGLIGLVLVHAVRSRNAELRNEIFRWILLIVALSFAVRNIDHAAHIGGFVTGCLFGLGTRGYVTSGEAERWRIPACAAGLAVLACLGFAAWNYFAR
jgi:membrane associated rhomboid family serine protease